ncbi:amino acid ABC transporter permease [Ruicaihuangia caeni]|uniref:Amino acid ABC transporter permease n=1 Tax=Ruicaihuangia caeni TaxID=3042517 RepID=A0AAW6T6G8_9MICO|nr:amino acid ABC transporter permease [Klugiella sp. YN-L-19]MDI2099426.1 amino acid ABC transporter permease [Klugiella sp. YN-L-19]
MFDVFFDYRGLFIEGLLVTLQLNAIVVVLSVAGGALIGVARHYGGKIVRVVLGIPVDILRSIPLLVVLIWVFFASPMVFGTRYIDPFVAAVIGLSLTQGAYISEIVRGGLASVRSTQTRAGLALGMTRTQVVTRVVAPQALIRMLPPIGSQVAIGIKDSTLASVIAVPELFRQSQIVIGDSMQPFVVLTTLMVFYFVLVMIVVRLIDMLYTRVAARGAS